MAKVVRSPNYPGISLDEAVTRARSIYEKEHTHPAPRDAIARDIGYGSLNGASASVISALTKYGLLETARGSDQLKISGDAIDIVLHNPGEPDRASAIKRVAFRPALFNELHTLYGDDLPSDHTVGVYLQKKGFNPKTVSGVIRAYRDTIEFVNAETAGMASVSLDEEQEFGMSSATQGQPTQPSLRFDPVHADNVAAPSPQHPLSDNLVLCFNLAEDCASRTQFTGRVTQQAIKKLIALLEVSLDTFPTREPSEEQGN